MIDIQPYQFDPEESLQGEDDSDCFEESGIIEVIARREPRTLTGVSVNSVYQWTSGSADVRALDFYPSRLRIWHPVQP